MEIFSFSNYSLFLCCSVFLLESLGACGNWYPHSPSMLWSKKIERENISGGHKSPCADFQWPHQTCFTTINSLSLFWEYKRIQRRRRNKFYDSAFFGAYCMSLIWFHLRHERSAHPPHLNPSNGFQRVIWRGYSRGWGAQSTEILPVPKNPGAWEIFRMVYRDPSLWGLPCFSSYFQEQRSTNASQGLDVGPWESWWVSSSPTEHTRWRLEGEGRMSGKRQSEHLRAQEGAWAASTSMVRSWRCSTHALSFTWTIISKAGRKHSPHTAKPI